MYADKGIEFRSCAECEDKASRLHVMHIHDFFDVERAKQHVAAIKKFRRKRRLPTIQD